MAETRLCPTCGDTDLVLDPDEPIEGWSRVSCKSCHRVLEIGRPGIGPLVDPLWIDRSRAAHPNCPCKPGKCIHPECTCALASDQRG
jgi:hypothetical protein